MPAAFRGDRVAWIDYRVRVMREDMRRMDAEERAWEEQEMLRRVRERLAREGERGDAAAVAVSAERKPKTRFPFRRRETHRPDTFHSGLTGERRLRRNRKTWYGRRIYADALEAPPGYHPLHDPVFDRWRRPELRTVMWRPSMDADREEAADVRRGNDSALSSASTPPVLTPSSTSSSDANGDVVVEMAVFDGSGSGSGPRIGTDAWASVDRGISLRDALNRSEETLPAYHVAEACPPPSYEGTWEEEDVRRAG
jgi:hypothetical protein